MIDLGGICVRVEPRLLWTVHSGQSPEEFVDMIKRAARRRSPVNADTVVFHPDVARVLPTCAEPGL